MAVDYARSRATVEKLINEYGRLITLIDDKKAANPANPLGPPAAPTVVSNVKAVFVRPSGYIKLGESFYMEMGMFEEAEKIALVLPSLTDNYERFTRILDNDGKGYKIFKVEALTPGDVPILLYLGLKQ